LGVWLNPIFEQVFPSGGNSYQAQFSPLQTLRPGTAGAACGVHILNIPPEYAKKDDIFAADAEAIARYIRWASEGNIFAFRSSREQGEESVRKPEPKDFLILLRFKDGMDTYARALEHYGIPFSIAGGSSMADSVEMAELYKLLRLLASPDDQVLMIGVLRGLFFGLSDDELYQIKKSGGYYNIFSPVPEALPAETASRYGNTLVKLKEYLQWTRQLMPTVAIAKIIADSGLIPLTLGVQQSQSRTAYFPQVLELLRRSEMKGKTRFDQIVAELGTILAGSLEDELNLTAQEENAVRLMNLHKAKGLEAPVVFLAQPYKEVTQRAEIHIRRQGTEPVGYCTFAVKRGFHQECIAQPAGWQDYEDEELKYLEAEENRLVYVAATRSKNMLIISRSLKDKELKKNPWAMLIQGTAGDTDRDTAKAIDIDIDTCAGNILTVPDIEDLVSFEGDCHLDPATKEDSKDSKDSKDSSDCKDIKSTKETNAVINVD
jgi:ATP-dependent helicase/nuclease subunit A